jgi:hypothetical protein
MAWEVRRRGRGGGVWDRLVIPTEGMGLEIDEQGQR